MHSVPIDLTLDFYSKIWHSSAHLDEHRWTRLVNWSCIPWHSNSDNSTRANIFIIDIIMPFTPIIVQWVTANASVGLPDTDTYVLPLSKLVCILPSSYIVMDNQRSELPRRRLLIPIEAFCQLPLITNQSKKNYLVRIAYHTAAW